MICRIKSRPLQRKEIRNGNSFRIGSHCSWLWTLLVPCQESSLLCLGDDPCMLRLVETLVGRTLGSLRGLRRGLGRIKLLKNVNWSVYVHCLGIYKKYHWPQVWIDSLYHWIDLTMNRFTIKSIQPWIDSIMNRFKPEIGGISYKYLGSIHKYKISHFSAVLYALNLP